MKVRITPKTLLDSFNHCSDLKRAGVDKQIVTKEFDDFNVNYVFELSNSIRNNQDKLESYETHFSKENTLKFESFLAVSREYKKDNVLKKAA